MINEEGASVVEVALVFPMFIILTFAIIEFGVIMYDKAMITSASRIGARFGILFVQTANPNQTHHNDDQIRAEVDSYLKNGGLLISLGGPATHSVTPFPPPPRKSGANLSVTVSYPYNFVLLPSFVPGIPDSMVLSSTTTMRLE